MSYYAPRYLFRRHEILRRVIPGENFLEVGPGRLQLAQELVRFFATGTVVDFSKEVEVYFDRLPLHVRRRLELIVGDFTRITLPHEYDCAVACEVLEHVGDELGFLTRLHKSLKDGGQLVVSVPAHMNFWSRHDEIVGHLRRYEREQLVSLLESAGFRNVVIVSYGFPFVNFLRLARVAAASIQYRQKVKRTQEERTKESGLVRAGRAGEVLGLVVNPITVYPLAVIARAFNNRDWSNGYIAIARKGE